MLDVRRSPELQAALLGLKQAERVVRLDINKDARKGLSPLWAEALRGNSETRLDDRVITKGARVAVGVRQVSLKAATSNRPLKGGLIPSRLWYAVEFGARRRQVQVQAVSPRGTAYSYTRTVNRQLPGRVRNGRVAFEAASGIGTKLVGIWLGTIVDAFRSFAEVKR
jgi:hypothetical protein